MGKFSKIFGSPAWGRYLLHALGNCFLAIGVAAFVLQNDITMAGVSGIGILLYRLTGITLSLWVFLLNGIFLVLSYFTLGKRFFLSTLFSSLFYPVVLMLFENIFRQPVTENVLTAVLFSGVLMGCGIGLVIRAGGSTGGMDIPELLLHRYTGMPMSICVLFLDAAVLLFMLVDYTMEQVLNGILLVAIQAFVMEKTILFGSGKMQIKVVTNKAISVSEAIMEKCHRGTTLLKSRTGYEHVDGEVVLTVLSARELSRAKEIIRETDEKAFVIVNPVSEVHGNGFDLLLGG